MSGGDHIDRYLELFLEESTEQVDLLNESLLALEQSGPQKEIIDELFRSAHTLKSSAAFVGRDRLSELAHHMEDLLSRIRDGEMAIETDLVNLFFRCVDRIRHTLVQISNGETAGDDYSDLRAAISEFAARGGARAPTPDTPESTPLSREPIDDISQIKVGGSTEASDARKQTASSGADSSKASEAVPTEDAIALTNEEEQQLKEAAQGQPVYAGTVRLDAETAMRNMRYMLLLENLKREITIFKSTPSSEELESDEAFESLHFIAFGNLDRARLIKLCQIDMVEEVHVVDRVVTGELVKATEGQGGRQETRLQSKNIKVSSEKIDYLMNNMGELVIINSGLQKVYDDLQQVYGDEAGVLGELKNKIDSAVRNARDLQSGIMKMRMMPVSLVFHRFTRPVRDLGMELGKEVQLEFHGEDTELDKNIIDSLNEPLLHLLRNSIDHGIENAEERFASGKDPVATIRLAAFQSGNNVFIEVRDDGRGLNRHAILKKAKERGLVSSETADELNEMEILDLIFQPGFSTAEQVSDLSGRGVGMNVVRKMVEDFKGTVQVISEPGQGAKFLLSFPLTLAIVSAIIVEVEKEEYAFPLADVVETIKIMRDEVTTLQGKNIINLRGDILPVFRLSALMGLPEEESARDEFPVLIAATASRKVGFIVDRLIGKTEIVIKSLEQNYDRIAGLIGACLMGDGRIIMVLDVQGLLDMASRDRNAEEVTETQALLASTVQRFNAYVQEQSASLRLRHQEKRKAAELQELKERPQEREVAAVGVARSTSTERYDASGNSTTIDRPTAPPSTEVRAAPVTTPEARDQPGTSSDSSTSGPPRLLNEEMPVPTPRPEARAGPLRELTDTDYERLQGVVTTSMGNAGGVLSQLLGVKVDVTVPEFRTVEFDELSREFAGTVYAVYVGMEGGLEGTCLLLFDETTGRSASADLMGYGVEHADQLTREDVQSVLSELANIVSSSLLNELSNETHLTTMPGVPEFMHGPYRDVLDRVHKLITEQDMQILYVTTDFYRTDLDFLGRLLVIPTSPSLARVLNKL